MHLSILNVFTKLDGQEEEGREGKGRKEGKEGRRKPKKAVIEKEKVSIFPTFTTLESQPDKYKLFPVHGNPTVSPSRMQSKVIFVFNIQAIDLCFRHYEWIWTGNKRTRHCNLKLNVIWKWHNKWGWTSVDVCIMGKGSGISHLSWHRSFLVSWIPVGHTPLYQSNMENRKWVLFYGNITKPLFGTLYLRHSQL